MKRALHYMNKGIILLFFLFLIGCVKEETIYFDSENKDWITGYEIKDNFIMKDNNGISHSFSMTDNSYYFNESEGGYFFVTTHKESTEYHYQNFTSNYGTQFSLSLTAGFEPFGDDIYIKLDNVGFAYDFKYQTISRIDSPFGYLSRTMTDKGYENNVTINSTVEIIDSYVVNDLQYSEVLHLTFKDFVEQWEVFTVKEIFIAKKYGLIKYILNNDLIFERK
jgi:hypothetical protein